MSDKDTLRATARQKRAQLDDEYCESASRSIVSQLIKLAKDSVSIHSFEPMLSKREVDIRAFNEWVQLQPDKQLHIQDLTGNFPDQQFDMVVVPGLAFDPEGNRVGYGGGHYDRFLVEQQDAISVGVCYKEQLKSSVPVDDHDYPVRLVITN